MNRLLSITILLILVLSQLPGMGRPDSSGSLILYSGRSESLVDPLVRKFESETGLRVQVRYGGTSELAVLLAEEGGRSPADIFWAQDAGGLGSAGRIGLLAPLPGYLFSELPDIYQSSTGLWIATSGRARLYAYSLDRTAEHEHPESIFDLTGPGYNGRVGWAPTNGSLQAFITAMRLEFGDARTLEWMKGMLANDVQAYRNNTSLIEAIAAGEIDFSLVNNYYLSRFTASDPEFPVGQNFFAPGDIGNMVNTAGAGIIASSSKQDEALKFIEFLLSSSSQRFFLDELGEYPVRFNEGIEGMNTLLEVSPPVALDSLDDLEGTLNLMRQAGVL